MKYEVIEQKKNKTAMEKNKIICMLQSAMERLLK